MPLSFMDIIEELDLRINLLKSEFFRRHNIDLYNLSAKMMTAGEKKIHEGDCFMDDLRDFQAKIEGMLIGRELVVKCNLNDQDIVYLDRCLEKHLAQR